MHENVPTSYLRRKRYEQNVWGDNIKSLFAHGRLRLPKLAKIKYWFKIECYDVTNGEDSTNESSTTNLMVGLFEIQNIQKIVKNLSYSKVNKVV